MNLGFNDALLFTDGRVQRVRLYLLQEQVSSDVTDTLAAFTPLSH